MGLCGVAVFFKCGVAVCCNSTLRCCSDPKTFGVWYLCFSHYSVHWNKVICSVVVSCLAFLGPKIRDQRNWTVRMCKFLERLFYRMAAVAFLVNFSDQSCSWTSYLHTILLSTRKDLHASLVSAQQQLQALQCVYFVENCWGIKVLCQVSPNVEIEITG